jgi:3-phenylpropionate/trans-cinnamate dioxygenase ferredoxin subunit
MTKYVVGTTTEVPPGGRKVVEVRGISIGVFNVHGTYCALRNRCPHQGGPLCLGNITGTMLPSAPGEYRWAREGEILRCPWHGWEFELPTGRSISSPQGVRVRTYPVSIEPPVSAEAVCDHPCAETLPVTVEADRLVVHL